MEWHEIAPWLFIGLVVLLALLFLLDGLNNK